MKQPKKNRLSRLLKEHHTGEENAITGKDLDKALRMSKGSAQKLVRQLRQDGVPVCSSNKGYFYAETRQEIAETVVRLNRLVTAISQTQNSLLQTTPDERKEIVMVIPQEGIKLAVNVKKLKRRG